MSRGALSLTQKSMNFIFIEKHNIFKHFSAALKVKLLIHFVTYVCTYIAADYRYTYVRTWVTYSQTKANKKIKE